MLFSSQRLILSYKRQVYQTVIWGIVFDFPGLLLLQVAFLHLPFSLSVLM